MTWEERPDGRENAIDTESTRNILAIRRGLEAVKKGETITAEEVFADVWNTLGLDFNASHAGIVGQRR